VTQTILRIAVPSPLYRSFDYLPPAAVTANTLQPGSRIRVPFGRRKTVGILLEVAHHSEFEPARLKPALEVLDTEPVLSSDILAMTQWASAYYQHPIGDALATALPVLLRRGQATRQAGAPGWRLTPTGRQVDPGTLSRAPRQAAVIQQLHAHPQGAPRASLDVPAEVLRSLNEKGWIEPCTLETPEVDAVSVASTPHSLNAAQQSAVDTITAGLV